MKKNAGISTIMVTSMAAFVSIFTMVLLIVLRGALGSSGEEDKVLQEVQGRADAIKAAVEENMQNADLEVYWDKNRIAAAFIGKDKFSVIWKSESSVLQTSILYEDASMTDDEKVAYAKEQIDAITKGENVAARSNQKIVATKVRGIFLNTFDNASAVLQMKLDYSDAQKKAQILQPDDITISYSDGVKQYRASKAK